jgi:hypothetical protein
MVALQTTYPDEILHTLQKQGQMEDEFPAFFLKYQGMGTKPIGSVP